MIDIIHRGEIDKKWTVKTVLLYLQYWNACILFIFKDFGLAYYWNFFKLRLEKV